MSHIKTKFGFIVLFLLIFSAVLFAQPYDGFLLQEGTYVVPVDGERAKELLKTEDEYTAILSRFDLMSKTGSKSDTVKLQDYLIKAASTVKKWDESSIQDLKENVEAVSKKIRDLGLKIKMPERIEIILSDMSNEGGAAGYTRSNYIVLPDGKIAPGTFIHELFHVFSRYDKQMSEKVYNTIGFKKCNEVPYPTEISDLRISNPDAPFNDFYITVNYNDAPVDVMLILFSGREYTGGSFFGYMQLGLMAVEGESGNKKVIYRDGKPLILKLKEVKGFYEQTGKNTSYNIHAEELSADHFVMLLDKQHGMPNPEIIEAMKQIMQ
ncbi:MAG TPA: hypothetical protein PK753_11645 [Ignavibacteria bacterium]|nr:hypothetical protein [Ignavibacteria bacterium]